MDPIVYAVIFVVVVPVLIFFSGIRIVGNAQLLRKLEALENALSHNAKIVVPSGCELVNVIGEMAGVLPLTDGNGRRRAEEGKHGLAELGQVAQRAVTPSVPRERIRS